MVEIVATQGDPDAEVNRGLNCIKGYFLSKIMYGADRVQTPLLRMKMANSIKKVTLHRFLGIKLSLSWRKKSKTS